MFKVTVLAATALCVWAATPAMAHRMHHHARFHHGLHRAEAGRRGPPYTIGYGETIISGRTGQHLNLITQSMVPDTDGPGLILTGRRRGSGFGANGLPGSNLDD